MYRKYLKHIILYILTVISTYYTAGFWYSFFIMAILTAHEMGHFIASRKYGVPATLPLFIPFPFSPFGTLGAIIFMRGRIKDRRSLFDIGAAGPLAGLVLAFIAAIVGLGYSQVIAAEQLSQPAFSLGDSLIFLLLQRLVLGEIPPGHDVLLHPIAYAGWVGLFVTAINLFPIGQLDGGHICYSMFGKKGINLSRIALGILIGICLFYNLAWTVFIILLLFMGIRHPAPLDDVTPLDGRRKLLGLFTMLLFVMSFTPIPFPEYAM